MATRPFLAGIRSPLTNSWPAARSAARTLDGRHGAARSGVSSQPRGGPAAPEGSFVNSGDNHEVGAALRALPAEYSSVIVETFYRGRNVPETADVLGVSADMVKARCYDALHALKHALAERGLIA
jgi:DNA-directed RNA polymerase specialized sigma24 family protein